MAREICDVARRRSRLCRGPDFKRTQLQEHLEKFPAPADNYETEINLAALEWIEQLSAKIERGVVLAVDYGFAREEFYAPSRTSGTLRSVAKHRLVASPLVDAGNIDITAHVDWTSLCEKAERCGLTTAGFVDQHHFITALAAVFLPNELSAEDRAGFADTASPRPARTDLSISCARERFPASSGTGGIQVRARSACRAWS